MGTVYHGYQPSLDREVAVKTLSDSFANNETFVARFQREARAAASLVHPNVIQVYSIGCEQGIHYFAMEFVKGMDLSEHLQAGRRFSFEESLDVIIQVAQALVGAEEVDLLHRDIKPSNIMLTEKGLVKMTDFGLAKTIDNELTQAGTVVGTANYMSPEQGQGLHLDTRSDIYSLGIVFYELITGRPPFLADSAPAVLYKHAYEVPPAIKSLNPEAPVPISEIIMRMLAKEPDKRPQGAGELLDELRRVRSVLQGKTPVAVPAAANSGAPESISQVASDVLQNSVLIVDKLGLLPALFGSILQEQGLTFNVVKDGKQASESALNRQPELIIIDMDITDPNGRDTLAAFADSGIKSRIIAIANPQTKAALEKDSPIRSVVFLLSRLTCMRYVHV